MEPLMFAQLMLLAFVATEGVVEYLLGTIFEKFAKLTPYSWVLKYVSALVGIGLAFFYRLDAISLVGLPVSPVGTIITGVFVGRGANFINDLFELIKSWTKK